MASIHTRIANAYRFTPPADLFSFWDFTNTVGLTALEEAVDLIALEGPFDFLTGNTPADPWWEARHYNDPPEFFTVMSGLTDGLHWGYYLDDPANERFTVASYYSHDAFIISNPGDTLFDALRAELELHYRDSLQNLVDDPNTAAYEQQLAQIDAIRAVLQGYATSDRSETGEDYANRYSDLAQRQPIAATRDGMGIVASSELYRPLTQNDPFQIWNYQPTPDEAQAMTVAALQALADGYPATALKLGKDLWIYHEYAGLSYALLDAAYRALNRPLLSLYLERARAHRA